MIGAGPAGLAAARCRRACRRARACCATRTRRFGGSLVGATATIDGLDGAAWLAAIVARARGAPRRHAAAANHGIRLLRRQSRRLARARRRSSVAAPPRMDAAPAPVEGPRAKRSCSRPARTSAASPTRTTTCRERCWRAPCALTSSATPCGPDHAPSCSRTTTARTRQRSRCIGAGVEVAAIVDPRVGRGARRRVAARGAGRRPADRREVRRSSARTARCVSPRSMSRRSPAARRERIDCDLVALSGGWNPGGPSPLAGARQASLRRCARDLRSRRFACADHAGGRGQRTLRPCRGAGGRARRGARRRAPRGLRARRASRVAAGGARRERSAAAAVERARGHEGREALRRLAERRHRRRHRARRARRLPLGRASQALHDARHGHRPGQDVATSSGSRCWREQLGVPIAEVGTTTFRPPYTPVTLGAFPGIDAGPHVEPTRYSAMHDWHVAHGARFVNAGLWKRPHSYPRAGESADDAAIREARNVRANVGIVDVSTLGKIELQGTRRRRVPEPRLHQPLGHAPGRPLPLRRDAARRRHRARRRHDVAPRAVRTT